MRFIDCYQTLELTAGAEWPEIHAAYKRMAMRYHPDHAGDNSENRRKFCAVTQAYATLQQAHALGTLHEQRQPQCARCNRIGKLYWGMDQHEYCADCLLNRGRRLLPAPKMIIVRCVIASLCVAGAAACAVSAWTSNSIPTGLAAVGLSIVALSALSFNVLSADVIE